MNHPFHGMVAIIRPMSNLFAGNNSVEKVTVNLKYKKCDSKTTQMAGQLLTILFVNRQYIFSGHSPHFGWRGRHMAWPNHRRMISSMNF